MKTLLLIRHAKSSWDSDALSDFDRPLNERGKNDAPMMAKRLLKKKIDIDAFISSPAKRAKRTAELFIDEYKKNQSEIVLVSALYLANPSDFYEVIEKINDSYEHVALFSHNSGITYFANSLTDAVSIDNMPTCSVFGIKLNAETWSDFAKAKKEFWFFEYPKKME